MNEILLNLHIHSLFSDGHATYHEIAKAAADSGLDVIIITDHNVSPVNLEGYYEFDKRRVLVLTGEEIHDQSRLPQKSHLLVFNQKRDMATYADRLQTLVDRVNDTDSLAFIAHPIDPAMPFLGEPDISWEDWDIHGFHGLELWNGLSEIKHVAKNRLQAAFYVFFPQYLAHSPIPEIISIWDTHLIQGKRLTAICGSDAHRLTMNIGWIKKLVFPYEYHFTCLNNHLLLPEPLSGQIIKDKAMIYSALKQGNLFIGYDLPHPTRGFHFSAQGQNKTVTMGGEISAREGVTFQIRTPAKAKILLIKDGKTIERWKGEQVCTYTTNQEGSYRVEAWINFLGQRRGWIFSNPIYVRNV